MSERQKNRVVKLVRELLRETPTRVAAVEKLRVAVDQIDARLKAARASRRKQYNAYLKYYGVVEGRKHWRRAHYDLIRRSKITRRRRRHR